MTYLDLNEDKLIISYREYEGRSYEDEIDLKKFSKFKEYPKREAKETNS